MIWTSLQHKRLIRASEKKFLPRILSRMQTFYNRCVKNNKLSNVLNSSKKNSSANRKPRWLKVHRGTAQITTQGAISGSLLKAICPRNSCKAPSHPNWSRQKSPTLTREERVNSLPQPASARTSNCCKIVQGRKWQETRPRSSHLLVSSSRI